MRGEMMRKSIAAIVAGLIAITPTQAHAQLGGLFGKALGLPREGEAGGSYQSNNQIRTFITAKPYDDINLYEKIIVKAAEMARAKNFARFGVTKVKCTMLSMYGSPRAKSCYVIAVMLNEGGEAKARGKRRVQYYDESEVEAGRVSPPFE